MNEFEIINKYLKPLSFKNKGSFNLGDDIFYDFKKKIAISVDTYVHGIHFISTDPEKCIKKSLRSSLSDLYCKGIKPTYYFLSMSINKKICTPLWFDKLKRVLNVEQKKFNIYLGGGDTTYSSKFSLTFVVVGKSKIKPVLRKGCFLDDDIYVTGNVGDAFIGLNIIKKKYNFKSLNNFFVKKYYEPDIQTKICSYLHKIATSSIDISDGLIQDLNHLISSNNFGAFIDAKMLPFSNNSKKLIKEKRINFKNIFSKGDDYQILFTSNKKNRSKIIKLSNYLNIKISRIGQINNKNNIILKSERSKFAYKVNKMGYTHNF